MASSLPGELPLLSMPDSLSACQGGKNYTDPAGELAVRVVNVAATTQPPVPTQKLVGSNHILLQKCDN